MNQKFGVGDVVTDGKFRMRVLTVIQEEDGSYFYECEPIDFRAMITREIPQDNLKAL